MKRCRVGLLAASLCLGAAIAGAQESRFASDLRREGEHVAKSCDEFTLKGAGSCAYTLVTDYPFHVALGNLPPQNGFAFGVAFSERYTPNESWRLSWNADVVAAPSGAWRTGASMKIIRTPSTSGVGVSRPGSSPSRPVAIAPREHPVVDLFAQSISLETVNFFGPGNASTEAGRAVYGERQTIVGGTIVYPLTRLDALRGLSIALNGGVRGRFPHVRPGNSDGAPSIERLYDDVTAPGLARQSAFVQFHEAVRFTPTAASGRIRLNYLLAADQFRTSRDTRSSFDRWTIDLRHEIPLYRGVASTGPRYFNGPNECASGLGSAECPKVTWSRNREGAIGFRLLVQASTTGGGNRVPFYLQPTLGGSDINGDRVLASYADYRFRGPYLLALQENLEHSIWGPLGLFLEAEHGQVAVHRSDLRFKKLRTSATVGVTLRAGGFPMVKLSFSWGAEGHHVIGTMESTLLGGSARPSLY